MKIRDLIEELEVLEKDYGGLSVNCGREDIYLEVKNNTLMIAVGPEK